MKFASRIDKVPPYLFVEISRKIAEKREQGIIEWGNSVFPLVKSQATCGRKCFLTPSHPAPNALARISASPRGALQQGR